MELVFVPSKINQVVAMDTTPLFNEIFLSPSYLVVLERMIRESLATDDQLKWICNITTGHGGLPDTALPLKSWDVKIVEPPVAPAEPITAVATKHLQIDLENFKPSPIHISLTNYFKSGSPASMRGKAVVLCFEPITPTILAVTGIVHLTAASIDSTTNEKALASALNTKKGDSLRISFPVSASDKQPVINQSRMNAAWSIFLEINFASFNSATVNRAVFKFAKQHRPREATAAVASITDSETATRSKRKRSNEDDGEEGNDEQISLDDPSTKVAKLLSAEVKVVTDPENHFRSKDSSSLVLTPQEYSCEMLWQTMCQYLQVLSSTKGPLNMVQTDVGIGKAFDTWLNISAITERYFSDALSEYESLVYYFIELDSTPSSSASASYPQDLPALETAINCLADSPSNAADILHSMERVVKLFIGFACYNYPFQWWTSLKFYYMALYLMPKRLVSICRGLDYLASDYLPLGNGSWLGMAVSILVERLLAPVVQTSLQFLTMYLERAVSVPTLSVSIRAYKARLDSYSTDTWANLLDSSFGGNISDTLASNATSRWQEEEFLKRLACQSLHRTIVAIFPLNVSRSEHRPFLEELTKLEFYFGYKVITDKPVEVRASSSSSSSAAANSSKSARVKLSTGGAVIPDIEDLAAPHAPKCISCTFDSYRSGDARNFKHDVRMRLVNSMTAAIVRLMNLVDNPSEGSTISEDNRKTVVNLILRFLEVINPQRFHFVSSGKSDGEHSYGTHIRTLLNTFKRNGKLYPPACHLRAQTKTGEFKKAFTECPIYLGLSKTATNPTNTEALVKQAITRCTQEMGATKLESPVVMWSNRIMREQRRRLAAEDRKLKLTNAYRKTAESRAK